MALEDAVVQLGCSMSNMRGKSGSGGGDGTPSMLGAIVEVSGVFMGL